MAAPAGDVPARLATLRGATSVEVGAMGAFAVHTAGSEAYVALASDREALAAHRAEVEALCQGPTVAARIYGAHLLRILDPAAGDRAFEALLGSTEPISYGSGCTLMSSTAGELAAMILAAPRVVVREDPPPSRRLLAGCIVAVCLLAQLALVWLILR